MGQVSTVLKHMSCYVNVDINNSEDYCCAIQASETDGTVLITERKLAI
jgi:hypothetical protein